MIVRAGEFRRFKTRAMITLADCRRNRNETIIVVMLGTLTAWPGVNILANRVTRAVVDLFRERIEHNLKGQNPYASVLPLKYRVTCLLP